jgi:hypothetical protein
VVGLTGLKIMVVAIALQLVEVRGALFGTVGRSHDWNHAKIKYATNSTIGVATTAASRR